MTEADRFPIEVFFSEEDEGYIAVAPDIPGSSAFGKTPEEAAREIRTVIALSLKAIVAAGNPAPVPSRPRQEEFSGKILLRIPTTLHAKLSRAAQQDGVSLNHYLSVLLAEANAKHQTTLEHATERVKSIENRVAEFTEVLRHRVVMGHTEARIGGFAGGSPPGQDFYIFTPARSRKGQIVATTASTDSSTQRMLVSALNRLQDKGGR